MSACEHCGQEHDEQTRFCPGTGKLIAARLLPPDTLLEGKYRVGHSLGVGGMGAVFEATHAVLGHKVAIKVLLPELSGDVSMSARLVREGRAACATGHPNIAMVTDMGSTDDGALFVVMEYLEGQTLHDIVEQSGPLSLQRAAALTAQVLAGLEAVHRSSIIHRDLKPDNIMVVRRGDEEAIKILDFGISKIVSDEAVHELTATGLVIGTPAYMAPEQSKGAATVDHRADIYSVGAICYKLLTGSPPLTAPNLAVLLAKLVQGEIEPPSTKRAGIPPALDQIVMQSLALEPSGRFPDARSFRRALEPFARGDHVQASALPAPSMEASPAPTDFEIDENSDVVSLDAITIAPEKPKPAPAPAPSAPEPPPPVLAPGSFAPPEEEDSALLLDRSAIQARPEPVAPPRQKELVSDEPEPGSSLAKGSARRAAGGENLRKLMMVLGAVIVVAAGLWYLARDRAVKVVAPQLQIVTIRLKTIPQEVDVYVDGVMQVGTPIRLPRSSRTFLIRIGAKNFRSKTLQVVPDRDHELTVVLTPQPKRY